MFQIWWSDQTGRRGNDRSSFDSTPALDEAEEEEEEEEGEEGEEEEEGGEGEEEEAGDEADEFSRANMAVMNANALGALEYAPKFF